MVFRQLPPLTDKAARAATKTVGVGLVPGLTLRVTKTKKTFVLRITQNGIVKWLPIGTYGPMSIAEARRVAASKLHEIENKGLLEVAPAPQRYDKYTVHDMLRDFIDSETERGRWDERGRQTHADKANGWIANHMSPEFLALPAIRLSPEIIKDEFGPPFSHHALHADEDRRRNPPCLHLGCRAQESPVHGQSGRHEDHPKLSAF